MAYYERGEVNVESLIVGANSKDGTVQMYYDWMDVSHNERCLVWAVPDWVQDGRSEMTRSFCVGNPVVEREQARVQGCSAPPVRLALPAGLRAVPAGAFSRQCRLGARASACQLPSLARLWCSARRSSCAWVVSLGIAIFGLLCPVGVASGMPDHRRFPLCSGVPADQLRPAAVLPVEEDRRPSEPKPGAEHLGVPVLLQSRAATRRLALQPAGSPLLPSFRR